MIAAWSLHVQHSGGSGPSESTLRTMAGPVARLEGSNASASDAVREIGAAFGSAGHALADSAKWFAELLTLFPRRQRERLECWEHSVDLAEGWLAGATVQDRRVSGGVDGAELLRYRLHQHYDRCLALGMNTAEEFALVVIDLGQSAELDSATRQVANDRLNDALFGEFRSGETVALFENGRAVVLCERRGTLANVVRSLVEALRHSVGDGAAPHGWVEPLPFDRVHVWGLVEELTGGAGTTGRNVAA
jgi:hypothetical protein